LLELESGPGDPAAGEAEAEEEKNVTRGPAVVAVCVPDDTEGEGPTDGDLRPGPV
jgi:hypothetical protein